MKVMHSDKKKGILKIRVECSEDLWHLSQIIKEDDFISGKTFRRIDYNGKSERKPFFLKVKVEKTSFEKDVLRASGKIVEANNDDVTAGEYHSFNIENGSIIKIEKKEWGKLEIERVKQAVDGARRPKLLIAVIDKGEADFFRLTQVGMENAGSFSTSTGGKQYKTGEKVEDFFRELNEKLQEMLKNSEAKQIVVAAVGFVGEDFKEYLEQKNSKLIPNLIFTKVNSTGKNGANELMKSKQLEKLFEKQRIYYETQVVEEVLALIAKEKRIAYGINEVREKIDIAAAEKLIISDRFIQENRQKAEKLMKDAEKIKAEIVIVSAEHEAGRKLHNLGGVAAELRY